MNVAEITTFDTHNGPGFRTSVWISGCSIMCGHCQNQHLWDSTIGTPIEQLFSKIENFVSNPQCSGLSVLGGEPIKFDDEDGMLDLQFLCHLIHLHYNKTIWLWTGYTWDKIEKLPLIQEIDVIIDGPYIHHLRDTSLAWRGSINQRIIDVKKSIENNQIILFK